MSKSLEALRAENAKLKETAEIAALTKENEHLRCVAERKLPSGAVISVSSPTVAILAKAEAMGSDEERGKYLIEVCCQLTPDEIEKLNYEEFAIYRDVVQSFF